MHKSMPYLGIRLSKRFLCVGTNLKRFIAYIIYHIFSETSVASSDSKLPASSICLRSYSLCIGQEQSIDPGRLRKPLIETTKLHRFITCFDAIGKKDFSLSMSVQVVSYCWALCFLESLETLRVCTGTCTCTGRT